MRRRGAWIVCGIGVLTGIAWFVYAPLSDVVCGNANGALDGRSDIYLWTCRRSCDRGDARSCLYQRDLELHASKYDPLGVRVARGQSECETGHACACADLGDLYVEQMSDPGGRALAHLRRACDGGCARGCKSLGNRLENRDDKIHAYERACAAGDALGCEWLAETFSSTDPARAAADFVRACERGWYKACWNGSVVNPKRMEMLGCRLNPDSCVRPTNERFFRNGETTSAELVSTLSSWCGRNEHNASLACTCLGEMLVRGKGMPADPSAGQALLDRECAGGGGFACLSLALHNPDRAAARAEIDRACTVVGDYDVRCEGAREHFARNEDYVVCDPVPVE